MKNEDNKIEGSFTMDNIQAVSNELSKIMNLEVQPMADKLLIDTAEGVYLDRKALDFNMQRNIDESDESFRQRVLEKIRKPITSGNINQYVHWAKSVNGVANAKCLSCWNGNGTVKVIVLSETLEVAGENLITSVKEYIEENRPIGATVTVISAKSKELNVSVELSLIAGYTIDEVKENIKIKLKEYLNTIVFDETKTFSYYKVGDVIFNVEGVDDIVSYTINNEMQSLKTEVDEFFQLMEMEVIVNGN